jgi:hypothetical protein
MKYKVYVVRKTTWMGCVFEADFNMWFLMEQRLDDLSRWFIMWSWWIQRKAATYMHVYMWMHGWQLDAGSAAADLSPLLHCYAHIFLSQGREIETLKGIDASCCRSCRSVCHYLGHVAWEPTWAHTAASGGFICLGNVQNWAYSLHAAHHDVHREILMWEDGVTMMARQIWRYPSLARSLSLSLNIL